MAAGAEVHRGDLEDLESLRSGAAMSDGVIHTACIHLAKRVSRLLSGTDSIAGRRCTGSMVRPLQPALEKGSVGSRYHAVAAEGVTAREIAEAIGRGLKVPVVAMSAEDAAAHFGWLSIFAGMDMPTSSALTQQRLGWRPTQTSGMIDDLDHASAFGVSS